MHFRITLDEILIFLIYIFLITCAVERLVEIIKQLFPQRTWKSQKLWKATMLILSFPIGFSLSLVISVAFLDATLVDRSIVSLLVAFMCTCGSKLWHDLVLAIVAKTNSK